MRLAAQTASTPRSRLLVADMPIGKKSTLTSTMSEPGGLETRISALDTTSYENELPLYRAFLWAVLGSNQ